MKKLFGTDISFYQNITDYKLFGHNNMAFVAIKATEGIYSSNPKFAGQVKGVTENTGALVFPYHFFHYEQDAAAQANHFCDAIATMNKAGFLPPVIDVEQENPKITPLEYAKAIAIFLAVVEKRMGRPAGIYSEAWYFLAYINNPKQFVKNFNWAAGANETKSAVPFTTGTLSFYQRGTSAQLAGVNNVDIDVFYGDINQLFAMAGGIFQPSLEIHPSIKGMQNWLAEKGLYAGTVDGQYWDKTKEAIKGFQTSIGTSPDGLIKPVEWASLFNITQID